MTEETIFLSAADKKDPTERAVFLDAACAGDSALRKRVEALLRSHADPDSFLNMPAVKRQAEEIGDPKRTTDLPSGDEMGPAPRRREAETTARDDVLALLAPGKEPDSLGRLDHYEILEVVGEGGMGVVFKARDTKLQRVVAVKVLAPQVAVNGTARKRFIREAQAGAAVRDDHVVAIYAVSDEGSVPYLAMEFIGGVTLEQRIKRGGPMEVKEVLRIGMQAAAGLSSAHRQGLIHRDVKPANILLENGVQRVKITDFGLARAIDDVSLTQPGLIAGTPLYMSPEQARGEALDQRSDLFSLGSVLYTLCTGRSAFSANNTMAVLKRVCEETPRPIRAVNPDIPEWLAALVSKLLAKEPEERFQTAAELAEVLGQHLARIQQPSMAPVKPAEGKEALPPAAPPAAPGGPARKRKRMGMAAALLGVVGVVASLVIIVVLSRAWLFPSSDESPAVSKPKAIDDDPRVLTVSQKPEDGGRYRTITEALENVESGMTIRVLDDTVYDEYLLVTKRHRGVILEATGKATLRRVSDRSESVVIRNVPSFTLRGFHITSLPTRIQGQGPIQIAGHCPGVVLDRLDITADEKGDCIDLYSHAEGTKDAPIVIKNCTMRNGKGGLNVEGRNRENWGPMPCANLVIRNNTIVGCDYGVTLQGAVNKVSIVGNFLLESRYLAINLEDLLSGTEDILIANNTLLRNETALRVWDDESKGKNFLRCKNIRVQNNLVLEPQFPADMIFLGHIQGKDNTHRPGDLSSLLNSPEWHFSHNWREIDSEKAERFKDRWIPRCANDHLQIPIKVSSDKPGNPNFLRPPNDSPLAKGGAGVSDPSLPAYVGAVPPEGVPPWDWQKTWDIQCRRLLTVSKDPAAGGHFRTIKEALDKVEPGMTIRVLDDAVYDEHLMIKNPEQHRGVVLEASGKATIRKPPHTNSAVWIQGVPRVTLRGFRFENGKERHAQVLIGGACFGVLLDRLDMKGDHSYSCVQLYGVTLSDKDPPIAIQNCTMREGDIYLEGTNQENLDDPKPYGNVLIRNNTLVGCCQAITATGAVNKVVIVGNRIMDCKFSPIDLFDLRAGAADILIANNTLFRNENALRIWDDHRKGKEFLKCKNIRVQNNLVLEPRNLADLRFFDHARGKFEQQKPGDLAAMLKSGEWRFSYNWREVYPEQAAPAAFPARWIPACPNDHLQVPIKLLSRKPGAPDFLRPSPDSPLAWSGAGGDTIPASRIASAVGQSCALTNPWLAAWSVAQTRNQPNRSLPAYVGAVPPEGVEAWDWEKTWKMMAR